MVNVLMPVIHCLAGIVDNWCNFLCIGDSAELCDRLRDICSKTR